MKKQVQIIIALQIVILSLVTCGQNTKLHERSFIQELNEMLVQSEDGTYSDEVMRSIFDFIEENPQSLDYEIILKEYSNIRIATSEDGNVRAYNLERYGFGGNPSLGFECKTLLQYRSGENVYCYEVESFIGYITNIQHIDSNKYYLLEDYQGSVCQGEHDFFSLSVYKIENDKLNKVKGAFVNHNNVSDNLEFSWDDLGGHLEMDYEKADSAFIYNRYRKELFVIKGMPLAGKKLKYRQYNWNGEKFEILKFDETAEFENPKYFIRIEQQSEDAWIYKCWNGGIKKGEPDLVLSGTKQYWLYDTLILCDEWWTDDASTPLGNKYTFCNNGYRYEFYYGWNRGKQHETLYVYDPDENMIYYGDFTSVDKP